MNINAIRNFNPRTPRGGATSCKNRQRRQLHFNPRTPRGGATRAYCWNAWEAIFQSTHPTRGCDAVKLPKVCSLLFQSTHPTRGCDDCWGARLHCGCYFNPRTPRGGATATDCTTWHAIAISIHAPHEGVRHGLHRVPPRILHFNPHTPRGGATTIRPAGYAARAYFNPRTPRGGAT